MNYDPEKEILGIIKTNPGVTYIDLVSQSIASTTGIWKMLQQLKTSGKIKSVSIKGRKAKGWRIA
jgi:uncharacterized membrane protein